MIRKVSDEIMSFETYDFYDGFDHMAPRARRKPYRRDGFVHIGHYAFAEAMTLGNYKTKEEAPYSYGVHVVGGAVREFKGKQYASDYSDRLSQWYGDKWRAACQRHLRARFEHESLEAIGKVLSAVYGEPRQCVQVLEGCNSGNGYPYWIFIHKYVQPPAGIIWC